MKILVFTGVLLPLLFAGCGNKKTAAEPQSGVESGMTAPDGHNSRNSLDWIGTYRGILPCADCEGIRTEIRLSANLTYEISTQYLGKSKELLTNSGNFNWDEGGNTIRLGSEKEGLAGRHYQVGENRLFHLDDSGNRIAGGFPEKYELNKIMDENAITDTYWKLVELGGRELKEYQGKEAHFILKEEGRRVAGNGGCNAFTGTYDLQEGNRLRFSGMASTKMACLHSNPEDEFLEVLSTTDNYSLKGDTLSLNKARMAPLARLTKSFFEQAKEP